MKIQRTLLAASLTAALAVLAACGGSSVTTPVVPPVATTTIGTLFDDAVSGATVFCDTGTKNGILDAGEESVTTGANGQFTFATACTGDIVSKPNTGTDIASLLTPRGSFRAAAGSTYVTPFTTMLAESGLSLADIQAIMVKLGLPNVDPGSFNPGQSDDVYKAAMAVAKILNDVAATAAANGGDAAAAFKAAVKSLATAAKSSTATNIFGDDAALGDLIGAAAAGGFASVSGWDDQKRANAAKIAKEAIKASAKAIKNAADRSGVGDVFGNEACADLVKQKSDDGTLADDSRSDDAANGAKNDESFTTAQYLTLNDLTVYSAPATVANTYTASALASTDGATLTGLTLATIDHVEFGVSLTAKALPASGKTVKVALEIAEIGSGAQRKLALEIDKVQLSADAQGQLQLTLLDGAEMTYDAVTHTGVEFLPTTPLKTAKDSVLTYGAKGLKVKMTTIINSVSADLPVDQRAVFTNMLSAVGTYSVKAVISEVAVRAAATQGAAPTKLALGSIVVPQDIDHKKNEIVSGALFSGKLTLAAGN